MTYVFDAKKDGIEQGILHCETCQDNVQMENIERDKDGSIIAASCSECGTNWEPQTYAVASGYEYNCPFCGHLNKEDTEPSLCNPASCEECGEEFAIYEVNHAE